MRRQAYIDWERVTEDNTPESGCEYLVAEIMGNVARQTFATWYNVGDIIDLDKSRAENMEEMSEQQRWEYLHSSAILEYVVRESGFYVIEPIPEEEKNSEYSEFAGCTEMTYKLCDDIFFAEIPLPPEGYLSEKQASKRMDANWKNAVAHVQEENIETIKIAMANDKGIETVVKTITQNKKFSNSEFVRLCFENGCCNVSTIQIGGIVIGANALINTLTKIIETEGGRETLRENLYKANEAGKLNSYIHGLLDTNKVRMDSSVYRYIFMYLQNLSSGGGFYYYRNEFRTYKKYKDLAHTMIGAYSAHKLMVRLERFCNLKQMNAPQSILTNELELLANAILEHVFAHRLEEIGENFPTTFGIYEDGSEYEGNSWVGNKEREILLEDELEAEDFSENVPDKYFVEDAPNFAFQNGAFALWNPKQKCYYRADGKHVSVYETICEAEKAAEEVNR